MVTREYEVELNGKVYGVEADVEVRDGEVLDIQLRTLDPMPARLIQEAHLQVERMVSEDLRYIEDEARENLYWAHVDMRISRLKEEGW